LALIRANESEAVAVQIEFAGHEVVAGGGGFRYGPAVTFGLDQVTGGGEPGEVFLKQAALATAAKRKFMHKLLEPGALAGRAFDVAQEFAVGHDFRIAGKGSSLLKDMRLKIRASPGPPVRKKSNEKLNLILKTKELSKSIESKKTVDIEKKVVTKLILKTNNLSFGGSSSELARQLSREVRRCRDAQDPPIHNFGKKRTLILRTKELPKSIE
jgi:hypothetical protein